MFGVLSQLTENIFIILWQRFLTLFLDRSDELVHNTEEQPSVRRDHLGSIQRRKHREEMQNDAQLSDRRSRAHVKNVFQEQPDSDKEKDRKNCGRRQFIRLLPVLTAPCETRTISLVVIII